jgi:hypothetical protein
MSMLYRFPVLFVRIIIRVILRICEFNISNLSLEQSCNERIIALSAQLLKENADTVWQAYHDVTCHSVSLFVITDRLLKGVQTDRLLSSSHLAGPRLWSSGQSSSLQIRRPGIDSRHYQKKK